MNWFEMLKMSDSIKWLMEHLDDNIIVELSGLGGGNEVEVIFEIPINPDFLEWAKDKYKIELIGEPWRRGTRNKYRIEAIGE
tara:strand:- start:200 stop:445 length:246 start_codon:yes stop_codon:yes gene_type:complete